MKNCLVLLTKKYPLDTGEEFIENEIPFLAKAFDQIILIATSVSNKPKQTRPTPENVKVFFMKASEIRRSLLAPVFLSVPMPLPKRVAGPDRKQARKSIHNKVFCSYFLEKSKQVFFGCRNILADSQLQSYDSVTFYSYWFYDTAMAAADLKEHFHLKNSRAVSRAHRYDLYEDKNPSGFLPMRSYLLQHLDTVFPCSKDGEVYLKERYPRFSYKIQTSYLGTQDQGISPENHGDTFHLASCCHISPVKRVELFAESLSLLKDSGLKLKWTHLGGGEGLEALKTYAKENLAFMECDFRGEISNSKLMEFYRTVPVDCFVNTSSSEGLPVSIMEAASFGIPVIATDVGGTSEIIRPEKTGYLLAETFSQEELAHKIEHFCRLPEETRQKMREASRALWADQFYSNQNYARFAKEIS